MPISSVHLDSGSGKVYRHLEKTSATIPASLKIASTWTGSIGPLRASAVMGVEIVHTR